MEISEFEKQLRLILKNRLSTRDNKEYIQWRLERKRNFNDLDHIAKKRNDLLLAERNHNEHISDEYKNYTDNFINALEELFTYVEYLQNKLNNN